VYVDSFRCMATYQFTTEENKRGGWGGGGGGVGGWVKKPENLS